MTHGRLRIPRELSLSLQAQLQGSYAWQASLQLQRSMPSAAYHWPTFPRHHQPHSFHSSATSLHKTKYPSRWRIRANIYVVFQQLAQDKLSSNFLSRHRKGDLQTSHVNETSTLPTEQVATLTYPPLTRNRFLCTTTERIDSKSQQKWTSSRQPRTMCPRLSQWVKAHQEPRQPR